MKMYRLTDEVNGQVEFFCTRAQAHKAAKEQPIHHRPELYVDFVEYPLDQASVVSLMNSRASVDLAVLRTWRITSRGGLKEIST